MVNNSLQTSTIPQAILLHRGRWLVLFLAGWLWNTVAMAQISSNCAPPTILVSYGCGGVVTLQSSVTTGRSTAYTWQLGNGTTATGYGPITVVYSGTGPYPVTLTVNRGAGCQPTTTSTTINVTPNQGGGCCPSGIAASNLLGTAGTSTSISGGGTYSGNWRVLGDLVLTNGNYTLTNATFYVDGVATKTPLSGGGYQRTVSGSTITVGTNATLTLDNSTLTASGSGTTCPMWRGVVLNASGRGPSGTYRLIVQNNSTISHALYGIELEDNYGGTSGTTEYLIDNSTFANNLMAHIHDNAYHSGPQSSAITNCTFSSDPSQMHYPYDYDPTAPNTAPNVKYYTYQALLLTPIGGYTSHALEVSGNTFLQAIYGIVNNIDDRAGVLIENNVLNKVFQTGIWTVNNDSNSGATTPVTSGNLVNMNINPIQDTDQLDPNATRFGIVGDQQNPHQNAFVGNTVHGDNNSTVPNPAFQVGMDLSSQTDASGSILDNLDEGIRTTELDASTIFDNRIADCKDGFVVQPSPNGFYNIDRLGCNTFSATGAMSTTRGIVVQPNAYTNYIGDFSNPAANKFDGLGTGIHNDGMPFTYFRTNSSQEAITTTGGSTTTIQTVFIPGMGLNNYCLLNQGANNGNGVNKARGAALSASYVAALMDSVRRQLVAPVRGQRYLYDIASYHRSTQQLPALETWWATLALPNAAAYRTVGRYLLRAYDQQPTTAVAAQRVLAGLQPAALLNAELAAQLKLRTVLRHLPKTTPRLAATDSVVLRALAWSGTSVAAPATRWLRYFHPRIALPAPLPAPALRVAATRKSGLAGSGASLGAAYPNPAQTEVTITCKLAQADQAAELRFTNLLTGQVQLVVQVEGTSTERNQRVALHSLPSGQYAYQLVVEGQLVAVPQKLIINP